MIDNESIKRQDAEKVLVTGGGGFLGKAIVKRLINRGDNVRSLARKFYPVLAEMGVDQIQGDISNSEIVAKTCEDRDVVFHVAAKPPPWGKYADYYNTNVKGTQNVIDACIQQNVSRLIYTSTPSVVLSGDDLEGVDESFPYPPKYNSFYPETKAMAERRVVKAVSTKLRAIILRPHQIWGPEDPHFVPRLLDRAKKLKRIGNGKNIIDTTYIDNAADAHIIAADKLKSHPQLSGNIYFISQGEPIAAWDMINALLNSVGHGPVRGSIPYRAAWLIGAVLEFFYRIFHLSGEPHMTRFLADALATSHWFDVSAAKRDLGYIPKISTEEGLHRLEKWLGVGSKMCG
jgi:nucleoside-diphosphate-sugar epimerase